MSSPREDSGDLFTAQKIQSNVVRYGLSVAPILVEFRIGHVRQHDCLDLNIENPFVEEVIQVLFKLGIYFLPGPSHSCQFSRQVRPLTKIHPTNPSNPRP